MYKIHVQCILCVHCYRRGIFAVFQNFPTVKKGVAQKTKFSILGGASSFRGDSRDILECPGSGIAFITITPIFSHHMTGLLYPLKSMSNDFYFYHRHNKQLLELDEGISSVFFRCSFEI